MFLQASTNNRKETVLKSFLSATISYGIPSRIRVDHGGENNDICLLMEVLRGLNRGSAIRGKSIHNQRIERAWVDVWKDVTNVFYDLFYYMEKCGYLDINDDTHLWALHFVFLPRLNRELNTFREQWNTHPLKTEHHQSPLQLFVQRGIELAGSKSTAILDMFSSQSNADSTSTTTTNAMLSPESPSVDSGHFPEISDIKTPIAEEALVKLQESIDPLAESKDKLGVDLFQEVLSFIESQS